MELSGIAKFIIVAGVLILTLGMIILHFKSIEQNPIVLNSSNTCIQQPLPTL